MKLKREDIVVGLHVRSFDEEDSRWYKAEVIAVREEGAVFKDIDPNSEFQGMEWDAPWSDVEDTEQFRTLK